MKLLKAAVVLSFAISLVSFGAAMSLNQKLQAEKQERQNLEAAGIQNQEKSADMEARTETYKKEMERVTLQLKALTQQKAELVKEIDESDKTIADLRKKLRQYETPGAVAAATASTAATSPVIATTAATVQKTVAPTSVPAAAAAASGEPKVLTVNRKFNFVVVNWGLKNQARLGDTLNVIRSGKSIADVQIEKVYDSFSAATILKESKDAPIQEGDLIKKA